MYDICYFFLIFFLYSILGYFIECFCCSIIEKRIVLNRGFCLGPYLPIFGFSAIVITFLFYPYRDMPLLLFFLSACSCTMIEYITSYLLELIFHARWWDYKDKKFNINRRVCLSNSILFGVAGLFCVHVFTPFFSFLLDLLSSTALITIGIICMVLFTTDVVITVITLVQIKVISMGWKNQDATQEISFKVHDQISKNRVLVRHLLHAFTLRGSHNLLASIRANLDERRKEAKENKK